MDMKVSLGRVRNLVHGSWESIQTQVDEEATSNPTTTEGVTTPTRDRDWFQQHHMSRSSTSTRCWESAAVGRIHLERTNNQYRNLWTEIECEAHARDMAQELIDKDLVVMSFPTEANYGITFVV